MTDQRYKDSIKDNFKDILVEIDNYFIPFYEINKRINNNYLIFFGKHENKWFRGDGGSKWNWWIQQGQSKCT